MLEAKIAEDTFRNREVKVIQNETEGWEIEARLAFSLVERWGLVAAEQDGEDSSGRAKVRHATAPELVSRACATAAQLVTECRERGWVVKLPTLAEIDAHRDALPELPERRR